MAAVKARNQEPSGSILISRIIAESSARRIMDASVIRLLRCDEVSSPDPTVVSLINGPR